MKKHFYLFYPEGKTQAETIELTKKDAQKLIPHGDYCYVLKEGRRNACPFWDKFPNLPRQENGFCHYLKAGDFTEKPTFLLWDQVKECGINLPDESEYS